MIKKRLFLPLLALLLLLISCKDEEVDDTVNVYNWGAYIDPDLVQEFEDETGIRVIYSYYATNEDLYVKLKNGGSNYDLIFPSDYMVERMILEDMLQPLDMSKIPNIKHLDEAYLHHTFDPDQKYSLPYFWGTLGIVYNKTMVHEPVDSWDILWNPKYKRNIVMMDSSRDSLAVALARNGFSINSKDPKQLEIAKEDLKAQFPLVYAYLVDQIRDLMKNNEAALAVMFSGDAMDVTLHNENLAYAIPKEGSNLWIDSFAIPKNADHKDNAYKFIDFMLRPENAARNADFVGYSLPSTEAKMLQNEKYKNSTIAYPYQEILNNLEVFHYPGEYVRLYDKIWQEVKNQ